MDIDRRTFAALTAGALLLPGRAVAAPAMTVHKDPTCGCCEAWVVHVRAAGYEATVIEAAAIDAIKAKLGVPVALWSCHTAQIDGYVLEGHVPAAAIAWLLAERPRVRGLAVPGMPIGSPGMEIERRDPETFDVMSFGDSESRSIMRFRGSVAL